MKVFVKNSRIHGKGAFAAKGIKKGIVIENCSVIVLKASERKN